MAEHEEPQSISDIKKVIQDEAEATGIVDSLFIEGIDIPLEQVRKDLKLKNPQTTPPDGEKDKPDGTNA
ncbi:MAG: hypothetical protein COX79_02415 [Candidatus Levybacteria bacterium CG_4_10_14_0_2_um_filter_36_16]|nr:MAG: hypothetical protein AUK12_02860 [Candidatus Levybacteria bacterium CG2_30_37_29]PIR79483.1 MAG: hypothetical protein COU26_00880 [Candidatus Levybacteria bacterium CG10_big_fil_rev_8_21_14_0_10_36_30]PIZ97431.1 MAG: hypothetical protein COX79_02415 [Candidatus Levybacteria bacterium CG_4_10_14_0_2_um_filter_36_16]